MQLTRRMALYGAAGAVVLACGGGLSWVRLGYRLADGDAAIGLSVKELCIVRAIVEALHPADGDLPAGLALGIHQRIDEEVWSSPDGVRADLKSAIALIEHLPPIYGFVGRFSGLSVADRLDYYQRLLLAGPGPVVRAAVAFKQLCALFVYSHDETWAAIGYDGPWVKRATPAPSSVRYAELFDAARTHARGGS